MNRFFEFFAGGGMARMGLGAGWECVFSNDWDTKKAISYRENFKGRDVFVCEDVARIQASDLPGTPDLVWGSFPCQDLSLAGLGAGLKGGRSGIFWPFWRLMSGLIEDGRSPRVIVLENVVGTLTSHGGKDFESIIRSVIASGYKVGAMVVDAIHFLPQSRPRLFIVAVERSAKIPDKLIGDGPNEFCHPQNIKLAHENLPDELKMEWIWWNGKAPQQRTEDLSDLLEEADKVEWHSPEETTRILGQMSNSHLAKVKAFSASKKHIVGAIYKRTRVEDGLKVQRAEVRFDGVSGCLRTPGGGSSRQIIIDIQGKAIRTRLLSKREAARLMGVPDSYRLPKAYNEAYHLMGDGLAVPVVSWLEKNILRPIIAVRSKTKNQVA